MGNSPTVEGECAIVVIAPRQSINKVKRIFLGRTWTNVKGSKPGMQYLNCIIYLDVLIYIFNKIIHYFKILFAMILWVL
jgi:hypothetical protein